MLNKQIAFDLGVSEKMVKVHRGRVMEKMRAGSLAELVRLADEGGVISAKSLIARAPVPGAVGTGPRSTIAPSAPRSQSHQVP